MDSTTISNISYELGQLVYTVLAAAVSGLCSLIVLHLNDLKNSKRKKQ